MVDKDLYNLLNRSMNGEISEVEKKRLAKAMSSHPSLKEEKRQLTELGLLLSKQDFRFKPFFASRVMSRLEAIKESGGILFDLNYAFLRISLPTLVAIFIGVLVLWGTEGSLTLDSLLGVSGVSYEELVSDFFVSN